jgi:putative chitinase
MITITDLQKIMPLAAKRPKALKNMQDFCLAYQTYGHMLELNTPERKAHFIAQVAHECDEFNTLEEYATGQAYENRRDLGNIHPGDGRRYKGRSYIQTTGRNNYILANAFIKKHEPDAPDIVLNPILLSARPDLAFLATTHFWITNRLNSFSDAKDISRQTRRINGGLNGLAHRQHLYKISIAHFSKV